MADALLLIKPLPALSRFLEIVNQFLGENIHDRLKKSGRGFSQDAEFLACLEAFNGSDENAVNTIRESRAGQGPLYYSFIIYVSTDGWHETNHLCLGLANQLYREERGMVLSIFTGNLNHWKEAVIRGTQSDNAEVRFIFDKVYLEFERLGLAEIWAGMKRTALPDRTFFLK